MLSVADSISGQLATLFPFPFFNKMQSCVLPRLLTSDENVVVAAPTASGKTVLAELAMVRELSKPRRGSKSTSFLANASWTLKKHAAPRLSYQRRKNGILQAESTARLTSSSMTSL
jgi:hypothetical protein